MQNASNRMPRQFDWIKIYLDAANSEEHLAAELEYYTERAESFALSPLPFWYVR